MNTLAEIMSATVLLLTSPSNKLKPIKMAQIIAIANNSCSQTSRGEISILS